jgi:ER lumen protein retaining receptor
LNLNAIKGTKGSKASQLILVDAAFAIVALMAYHWIGEDQFSSILTISAIFQCLALCLLVVHALSNGSIHAISAKSLKLEGVALACRLSTTVWLEGYVPTDHTGDWLYQCIDGLSLSLVLGLLYHLRKAQKAQHNASEVDADSLPAMPFVVGSVVIACLFHGTIMTYLIFDAIWMCGLFVGIVAVIPQLWLMTHNGGKKPALTSHFIAVMAFSRVLSGSYMWTAAKEITCEPWIEGFIMQLSPPWQAMRCTWQSP